MAFFKNVFKKGDVKATEKPVKKEASLKTPKTSALKEEKTTEQRTPTIIRYDAGMGVLVSPHVTEKSVAGNQLGLYTFKLQNGSNKYMVKKAVEDRFGVHVEAVRIMKTPAKVRRMAGRLGKVHGFTKAVVRLKKGERIEFTS